MVNPFGGISCPSQNQITVAIIANSENLEALGSPLHLQNGRCSRATTGRCSGATYMFFVVYSLYMGILLVSYYLEC